MCYAHPEPRYIQYIVAILSCSIGRGFESMVKRGLAEGEHIDEPRGTENGKRRRIWTHALVAGTVDGPTVVVTAGGIFWNGAGRTHQVMKGSSPGWSRGTGASDEMLRFQMD